MDMKKLKLRNWFADEDGKSRFWDETKQGYQQSIDYMQRELDKLREGMSSASTAFPAFFPASGASESVLRPKVDIVETEDSYVISLEAPGVPEDNISLEIDDNRLRISGEKKQEFEETEDEYYRMERSYGKFRRILALPDDVRSDDAEAVYQHGVVTVTLPREKGESGSKKKIELKKAS